MIVDCIITDNTRRYVVSRNKEDMDFHATNSASYLNSNANFVMKGDREKIRDISAAGLRARLVGENNIRSYTNYRNLLQYSTWY